jgi:hypothetical protein
MKFLTIDDNAGDWLKRALRRASRPVRGSGSVSVHDGDGELLISGRDRSGSNPLSILFPALVKQDGGQSGSKTTPCTWTYSLWPLGADVTKIEERMAAAVGFVPGMGRTALGAYVKAADGTPALVYYEVVGSQSFLRLFYVPGEQPAVEACAGGDAGALAPPPRPVTRSRGIFAKFTSLLGG